MKKYLKLSMTAALVTGAVLSSQANAVYLPKMFTGNGWSAPTAVFSAYRHPVTGETQGYRIPAIAALGNGALIAVADKRLGGQDIAVGSRVYEVYFSYRLSYDGGNTWSNEQLIKPPKADSRKYDPDGAKNWVNYISDPQIVHNPDTGSTFLFGYQSDKGPKDGGQFHTYMFKSTDGGRTWEPGIALDKAIPNFDYDNGRYAKFLQGPGNGMYYNGKLYVPIQAFKKHEDKKAEVFSSGMLVSDDDGKTWKQSKWVLNAEDLDPEKGGVDKNGTRITSESSVFHHKGYIYLAAKVEDRNHPGAKRQTWRTKDDGQTWERYEETFLPDSIVHCQSSSFALTDNIYFVGYTTTNSGNNERQDIWLTTNTGRRVQLYSKAQVGYNSMGYTSVSADADNLYVLFEGADTYTKADSEGTRHIVGNSDIAGGILLRKFDYAGKEYANLNGRLQRTGSDMLSLADTFSSASGSYIKGGYGSDNDTQVDGVYTNGKYKIGLFYGSESDVADDVYRTYGYDKTTASALLGIDGFFASSDMLSDTLFAGYQYATAEFSNSAKEESHAAVAGYRLNVRTDVVDWALTAVYRHASNTLERNSQEGLGKEAEYSTDILAIDNRVSRTFALDQAGIFNLKPFVGFEYIDFKHEGYSEKKGNGFNDITVDSASNRSYGPYIGAEIFGETAMVSGSKISYNFSARYKRELSDVEDWADSYIVFDEKFKFATPVDKSGTENLFEGRAEVMLDLNDSVSVGVKATADSIGDTRALLQCRYMF